MDLTDGLLDYSAKENRNMKASRGREALGVLEDRRPYPFYDV